MMKRAGWIAAGVVAGMVTGGIGYALVVNDPTSEDRYFACVSTAGVVKSSTIKLNVVPTSCPAATDVVESWNAVGQTGPTGAVGSTGPTGATGPGPDKIRTTMIRVADDPYVIPANGQTQGRGDLLGPIDVSACRSMTVNVVGAVPYSVDIYAHDPVSGSSVFRDRLTNATNSTGQGDPGSTLNKGTTSFYNGSIWGASPDIGGSLPTVIKMSLTNTNSTPQQTASHIWLDCVPWT